MLLSSVAIVVIILWWLVSLHEFGLLLWALLHQAIERILRGSHREGLFGKAWFKVLAFVVLFVFGLGFVHLLNLVSYLWLVTSWINNWKSDNGSLLLLSHMEIFVLLTKIRVIQRWQELVSALSVRWSCTSHISLGKRNTSERLLRHVALNVVMIVVALINALIWYSLTLNTSVLGMMSLALEISALVIINEILWKLEATVHFGFECMLFECFSCLYYVDKLLIFCYHLLFHF